jgi:hypothetical protein
MVRAIFGVMEKAPLARIKMAIPFNQEAMTMLG